MQTVGNLSDDAFTHVKVRNGMCVNLEDVVVIEKSHRESSRSFFVK